MSSSISTPDELSSSARRAFGTCWRIVEAENKISTSKITDTVEEQEQLENLIEESKPKIPPDCRHLHYWLATPFRYGAPYPRGSRFRRAGFTPGVFYASEHSSTAIAEMVFSRLLFFLDSPDTPWPTVAGEYTAFGADYHTERAIDLRSAPFEDREKVWMHPVEYEPCQELASLARVQKIEAIRYASVRDRGHRGNIAILTCRAFTGGREITARQTWRLFFANSGVRAFCEMPHESIQFQPDSFAYDPRMKSMRWQRGGI